MSAELMKSKFVLVRLCRNYLRTYWADSFQLSVLGCPGAEPGWKNEHFWKKITSSDFVWIFQFFVNIRPYANKNFKTLLFPQVALELF